MAAAASHCSDRNSKTVVVSRTGFNWNIPGTFATHDMSTHVASWCSISAALLSSLDRRLAS